jgi:ATP-dependent helicase IRC3
VVNNETINRLVVKSWLDRAGKISLFYLFCMFLNSSANRKSTLVFCVNLAHVRDLTNEFRSAGVDARYLHSGTPVAERKALLQEFKRGDYLVLVNCGMLQVAQLSFFVFVQSSFCSHSD